MPMARRGTSELVRAARIFWYNNQDGAFDVRGVPITRQQIQMYGGPRVELDACRTCQESEWLSRVTQANRFQEHDCPTSKRARWLCERQGHDEWSYLHQDFTFSLGCDPKLDAPKCLYLVDGLVYRWHLTQGGNHLALNRRRGFAQAFQHDCATISHAAHIEWQNYDLLFINNRKAAPFFERPPGIPMIMWGHDIWGGYAQDRLDHYKPEVLLASCPHAWRHNFKIPSGTDVVSYFASASNFYTRPNLRGRRKRIDLLAIGERRGGVYAPRVELDSQLRQLNKRRFDVRFSHRPPRRPTRNREPLSMDKNRYLNVYSAHLGTARFVIFGPCGSKGAKPGRNKRSARDMMMPKYYECLGSGAVPIMPHVSQLDTLQLEPYRHYIPLADVWGSNAHLAKIMSNYSKHRRVAENAVRWHQENADALLFDHFEDVVRGVTGNKYPRRAY